MSLKNLTDQTRKVARKFPNQWSQPIRYVDMMEEMGELANALLGKWGEKSDQRIKSDIADSFCDILYDLLLLAYDCEIDLDSEYAKMLNNLEKRIDEGKM